MACQNTSINQECGCEQRGNGFIFIIVLYILLAIILGSAMTRY